MLADIIDKFGNNLGALGFLIDMLNYQPALVKKLFVYDSRSGDLNPLMGREAKQIESFVAELPTIQTSANSIEAVAPVVADAAIAMPALIPVPVPCSCFNSSFSVCTRAG